MKRISSTDNNYREGNLSVFPRAKDSKTSLYEATNNAETVLKQTLGLASKYIILESGNSFPPHGLVKLTSDTGLTEVIYYGRKINNQLHTLQRGFGEYRQSVWKAGTKVSCPVMADHHNASKDAIIQIQKKIGLEDSPADESLNGILTALERKWLSPKAIFKAYPRTGIAPLTVHFHNFSTGYGIRFLWDFGDGGTTVETNPTHVFTQEGNYNVSLNIISATGSHGISEKAGYITVEPKEANPFFYIKPLVGKVNSTEFEFIDQTDGDILERHWFFGDGNDTTTNDPNIHTMKHIYKEATLVKPSLLIRFSDGKMKRVFSTEELLVS